MTIPHRSRAHFQHLVQGSCSDGPAEAHHSGASRTYYIKPMDGAVAVIFPIRFRGVRDIAIGTTFLQEFVEARRMPALGKSPECSYGQVSAERNP